MLAFTNFSHLQSSCDVRSTILMFVPPQNVNCMKEETETGMLSPPHLTFRIILHELKGNYLQGGAFSIHVGSPCILDPWFSRIPKCTGNFQWLPPTLNGHSPIHGGQLVWWSLDARGGVSTCITTFSSVWLISHGKTKRLDKVTVLCVTGERPGLAYEVSISQGYEVLK